MRVLVTTDSFPPGCGGSGWSTYELSRGLREAGHEVAVLQARADVGESRTRTHDGFTVDERAVWAPSMPFVRNHFKNERSYRRLVPVVREAIRRTGAEVVHAQHVLTAPPSVAAAQREGVPVVCTIRDYWPVCYWSDLIHDPAGTELCPGCSPGMMTRCIRPRAGRWWPLALPMIPYMTRNLRRKRRALARADAIVAVSSAIARDLAARAPEMGTVRVETIPNPVDVGGIARAADSRSPLNGQPYAIYVGKLARNKGVASLVPAIRRARLPWPLVVIGDGPERAAVERDARQSGHDVRFLGWLDRAEALTWLAHARVVVFPSYGPESLSRVLLEASVLGRPIAAMDTGGTRDIVINGETGLVVAAAAELGDAVARLIGDEALATRLGTRAAAFVRERFAVERVVSRTVRLYEDLRAATGGASPVDG